MIYYRNRSGTPNIKKAATNVRIRFYDCYVHHYYFLLELIGPISSLRSRVENLELVQT